MKHYYFLIHILCVLLLMPDVSDARKNAVSVFEIGDGLCSSTLFLFTDHTYVYEHGCEAGSSICAGVWMPVKDTIRLRCADLATLRIIDTVMYGQAPQQDSITIRVLDKNNTPISNLVAFVPEFTPGYDAFRDSFYTGSPLRPIRIPKTDTVELYSLTDLFGRPVQVPVRGYDMLTIKLNVPAELLFNINSRWHRCNNADYIHLDGNRIVEVLPSWPEHNVLYRRR